MSKGKRNYGDGITDQRYRADGNRTKYNGSRPFRVESHYGKGSERKSRSFPTIEDARKHKKDMDAFRQNRGNPLFRQRINQEKLGDYPLKDLLINYRKYREKIGKPFDLYTVHAFNCTTTGEMSLADVEQHHLYNYFEQWAKEGVYGINQSWNTEKHIKPATVDKLRHFISGAYDWARAINLWGICHDLENPLKGMRLSLPSRKDKRVLEPHEKDALMKEFENCQGLNRYYGPLAMHLALDTAMRLQEVIFLKWTDIDFENRRIEIRESKTDNEAKGRVGGRIVLPVSAMSELIRLWHHLNTKRTLPYTDQHALHIKRPIEHPDSYIFIDRYGKHMTPEAMGDVFYKAVMRAVRRGAIKREDANKETLNFKCLRRTANDMLIAADLILEERMIMLRETGKTVNQQHYVSSRGLEPCLAAIQDKLDKHVLKIFDKDDNGKQILNDDDEPVEKGLTLRQAVRRRTGKKMTNLEMLEAGEIPLPFTMTLPPSIARLRSIIPPANAKGNSVYTLLKEQDQADIS